MMKEKSRFQNESPFSCIIYTYDFIVFEFFHSFFFFSFLKKRLKNVN